MFDDRLSGPSHYVKNGRRQRVQENSDAFQVEDFNDDNWVVSDRTMARRRVFQNTAAQYQPVSETRSFRFGVTFVMNDLSPRGTSRVQHRQHECTPFY
jgi:hypothetical protein